MNNQNIFKYSIFAKKLANERPEQFAHIAHLKKGNERIARLFFKHTKNIPKNTI